MGLFDGPETKGEAAGQTIGAIAGNAIPIPYIGSTIGSTIGKLVGGLFGGKAGRNTIGAVIESRGGRFQVAEANEKKADIGQAQSFGQAVSDALNAIADFVGFSYNDPRQRFGFESNVGGVETGTFRSNGERLSDQKADVRAVVNREIQKSVSEGIGGFILDNDGQTQRTDLFIKAFQETGDAQQALEAIGGGEAAEDFSGGGSASGGSAATFQVADNGAVNRLRGVKEQKDALTLLFLGVLGVIILN